MLAFCKRFRYRNPAFKVITGTLFATFCTILVMISQGVSVPFGTIRQKSTYHTKYLSNYKTKLHQFFSIGNYTYADYKTEIIFAVVEETLLW